MYPDRPSLNEVVVHRLEDEPPLGFDCGRAAQNQFLYEFAALDQDEWVSCTYLHFLQDTCVAYATVCMDSLPLGTREKPRSVRYRRVSALMLAQLGVGKRFQGMGLGREVIADVVALAREAAVHVGCRYVSLDAHPDLVGWYERHGFVVNKLHQKERIAAVAGKANPAPLAVSMRFDLRAV
jgi:GNAT superfamily N-acetyltransferase